MKLRPLAIRKLSEQRGTIARLPANAYSGEWFLLLRRDAMGRKIVERTLFQANEVSGRIPVYGFTHYVRLPSWLPWHNK